jgi:hypothetical protein
MFLHPLVEYGPYQGNKAGSRRALDIVEAALFTSKDAVRTPMVTPGPGKSDFLMAPYATKMI